MGGVIRFFQGLLSGFFGFLGGLFGQKKSDEGEAGTPPKMKRSQSGFYLELEDAKGVKSPEPASAKPASSASVAEPKKPEPVKAQPEPVKVEAAPKAAEPAVTAKALNLPQPVVTFAPDYLSSTSSTNGRRRPGANMNYFLDMARQVKTQG